MAALAAALLLGSIAVPLSAGAVTYDPCDVNHDGSVDISDVIAINQYLCGAKYFRNYNQLDANRSHTVDAADAQCVLCKVTKVDYSACYIRQYGNGYKQPVAMPAVSSSVTLDSYAQTSEARWYIGYSFIKNEPISRYLLNSTFANLNTVVNPSSRAIIGTDDRTVAHGYENTGIVHFTFDTINGSAQATGFIVGDHEIATAAHCVYDKDNLVFYYNFNIQTYDQTGAAVSGKTLTAAEIHIPELYKTATSYKTRYDYALITVEEDLSDYMHFQIGNSYNMIQSEVQDIPIHVTGIPGSINITDPWNPYTSGNGNSQNLLYTHFGSVYESNNCEVLFYTADGSGGQSGSPVYTITRERYNGQDHYTYTALAVNSGGIPDSHNCGPLMTRHHLRFYMNNPNIQYRR